MSKWSQDLNTILPLEKFETGKFISVAEVRDIIGRKEDEWMKNLNLSDLHEDRASVLQYILANTSNHNIEGEKLVDILHMSFLFERSYDEMQENFSLAKLQTVIAKIGSELSTDRQQVKELQKEQLYFDLGTPMLLREFFYKKQPDLDLLEQTHKKIVNEENVTRTELAAVSIIKKCAQRIGVNDYCNNAYLMYKVLPKLLSIDFIEDNYSEIKDMLLEDLDILPIEQIFEIISETSKIASIYSNSKKLIGQDNHGDKIISLHVSDSVGAGALAKSSWPYEVSNRVEDLQIANCAVPGAQTKDGLRNILADIEFFRPDFIMITLGGNDAFADVSPIVSVQHITEMLNVIKEACDGKYTYKDIVIGYDIPEKIRSKEASKQHLLIIEALKLLLTSMGVTWAKIPEEALQESNCCSIGLHPVEVDAVIEYAIGLLSPIVEKIKAKKNEVDLNEVVTDLGAVEENAGSLMVTQFENHKNKSNDGSEVVDVSEVLEEDSKEKDKVSLAVS